MAGKILDWLVEHVISWLLVIALVLIVLLIPVLIYCSYLSAKSPHLELIKKDWTCTDSQNIPATIYVKSGDIMLPVTTYTTECTQWSKRQ